MYKIGDYIHNGLLYLNNMARPRHKKLSQLMIYATTICQSRCRHCSIWQKPHESLSLDEIKAIVGSRCVTPKTVVGLEGGEFVLHPQYREIMAWLRDNHPYYTLLSNGIAVPKVVDAVRRYKPVRLYLSLDGDKQTYPDVRGVDAHDSVIELIETLKDEIPVSLMFCLTPWNSFKDMEYVIGVAKKYGIDVRIGIYGTMDFFDTKAELLDVEDFCAQIPASIHDTDENFDFVALYDEWRHGRLKLRCQSIYSSLVIHSNGDVPVCQNLGVNLGNIRQNSLDEIFNGKAAHKVQCNYDHNCNGCWINFHRKYDIILLRNFEKLLPKRVIEWFYGPYQWTDDRKMTYKRFFNGIDGHMPGGLL